MVTVVFINRQKSLSRTVSGGSSGSKEGAAAPPFCRHVTMHFFTLYMAEPFWTKLGSLAK